MLKIFFILIVFINFLYGYGNTRERASVLKEYIMMKLCIKDNDGYFTAYKTARNNCACAIENLPTSTISKMKTKDNGRKIWREMKDNLKEEYQKCESLHK